MLTPLRISTLCVALTAVLSATLLVADSATTSDSENQTISASGDIPGQDAPESAEQELPEQSLLVVADLAPSGSTNAAASGPAASDDDITTQDAISATDSDDPASPETAASNATMSASAGSEPNNADSPASESNGSSGSDTDAASSKSIPGSGDVGKPKAGSSTPTTAAPKTTEAPKTTSAPAPSSGNASKFEPMRNNNDKFGRQASTPSNQLNTASLMEPVSPVDNGGNGTGQFRIACEYSHFNSDDPIVYPGQPGKSHFHMYFGNTKTDAYTTKDSLVNSGGGSCNGFELNRSSYWTPALLDGKGNAIVPDQIIVYYKTKFPNQVQAMPQGLQIIGGNANGEDFSPNENLFWSCGGSGHSYNHTNRIPQCGGDQINATIAFPQCWDGKNLTSSDFSSHMKQISESSSCPSSHPVRLPQLTYLLYFPPGDSGSWYLSSDRSGGFNTGPGATLHADWMGAWHEGTMDLWLDACVKRGRNCSYGQTGTPQKLAALNPLQTFAGNNAVPVPK